METSSCHYFSLASAAQRATAAAAGNSVPMACREVEVEEKVEEEEEEREL